MSVEEEQEGERDKMCKVAALAHAQHVVHVCAGCDCEYTMDRHDRGTQSIRDRDVLYRLIVRCRFSCLILLLSL